MYWRIEAQPTENIRQPDFLIVGQAGERVTLETRRLFPMPELEAITEALNALPPYRLTA